MHTLYICIHCVDASGYASVQMFGQTGHHLSTAEVFRLVNDYHLSRWIISMLLVGNRWIIHVLFALGQSPSIFEITPSQHLFFQAVTTRCDRFFGPPRQRPGLLTLWTWRASSTCQKSFVLVPGAKWIFLLPWSGRRLSWSFLVNATHLWTFQSDTTYPGRPI